MPLNKRADQTSSLIPFSRNCYSFYY